jgi:hypothetical protein
MLLIDYSSAFNTIVPTELITKLRTQGLDTTPYNWILELLTGRPRVVKVGNNTEGCGPGSVVPGHLPQCEQDEKELIMDYRKRRAEQAPH